LLISSSSSHENNPQTVDSRRWIVRDDKPSPPSDSHHVCGPVAALLTDEGQQVRDLDLGGLLRHDREDRLQA